MRVYFVYIVSFWLLWRLVYIRTSKGIGKCFYFFFLKIFVCRIIEVKRLNGFIRILKREFQMVKDYMECMEKIITKGYVFLVLIGEVIRSLQFGWVWYFFYFRVYYLKKLIQIRVVFDFLVKYEGVFLNGELLSGLDFMNSLLGVFFRFRMEIIVVMCDGNNSCYV